MEPNNNIEDQFRDKLNQREIKPSENSWDRLDAMLAIAEKPKRNYGWLYIAASFLGFLLIATVFFSQTEQIIYLPKNETVNQEVPVQQQDLNLKPTTEVQNSVQIGKKQTVVLNKHTVAPKNQSSIKSITKEALPVIANQPDPNQDPIAENSTINQNTANQNIEKTTYVDVDELLASVQKPGKTGKIFTNKTKVKVNPNTLLSQVDGELEVSFREKVIHTVNKNYKTVKVALSNRNKE